MGAEQLLAHLGHRHLHLGGVGVSERRVLLQGPRDQGLERLSSRQVRTMLGKRGRSYMTLAVQGGG